MKYLNLRATGQAAQYGHFGIEGLPWEATDKTEDLNKYIKSQKLWNLSFNSFFILGIYNG